MSTQSHGVDLACTTLLGFRTCLTGGNIAGLSMAFAACLLSLGSVLYAFFFMMIAKRQNSNIFYNPMDILIFALLFADLVQAVAGMLHLKWIRDGIVQAGITCEVQGVLQTLGESAVALTTLLISIYTFAGVATVRGLQSMRTTFVLVVVIWAFIGLLIGVGHAKHDPALKVKYIAPAPFWCWLGPSTGLSWKIGSEYLWLWLSLFVSFLLYIPLYLWMRGNLVFHDSVWYRWSFHWHAPSDLEFRTRRKALIMLMYPIVYCICTLPLSIVRWIEFYDEAKHGSTSMPADYTLAVTTIFGLSGFLNVLLVFTTKPNLGLFGRPTARNVRPPDVARFVRPENEMEVVGRASVNP